MRLTIKVKKEEVTRNFAASSDKKNNEPDVVLSEEQAHVVAAFLNSYLYDVKVQKIYRG